MTLTFRSVRVAPLYDAVTTRVFPRLGNDHIALKLNGKDDGLRRRDFRAFASVAGIIAAAADAVMDLTQDSMRSALERIALPVLPGISEENRLTSDVMRKLVRKRVELFD